MNNLTAKNDSQAQDPLRLQEGDGQIWIDKQRVLLLQLSSLAEFRKEQIETVGLERAKGFFMRLGYSMGKKDAQLARNMSNSDDPHDLIRTGFGLHSLKGLVKIEEQRLEIDSSSGSFHAEYVMRDSYEAEMFIKELGLLNESVCWSLIGQASAFTSELLGQEIIFKEITCRGCGDNTCLLIGKPAAEWDDRDAYRNYFKPAAIIEELYELQSQISVLRHEVDKKAALGNFRGQSPAFQKVCKLANRAAEANVTVLLLGETGVGKELVAKAIHDASDRNEQNFVAVNCAAIPPELIESELFGVEKGAYTGAIHSRAGRFERAHQGTIFLDEVVELSPRAQAALLRVLQEGELERVGDNQTRKIDVRVVAATNESLQEAVKEGRFRADLFYRLNVYPIDIPPLRERTEDIPMLIDHFLEKYHTYYSKQTAGLSEAAMQAMMQYSWPGNVRELENLIERGLILTDSSEQIGVDSLFPALGSTQHQYFPGGHQIQKSSDKHSAASGTNWINDALDNCQSLEDIEQQLLDYALNKANGNVSEAARILGLSRPTLAYRIKKMEDR